MGVQKMDGAWKFGFQKYVMKNWNKFKGKSWPFLRNLLTHIWLLFVIGISTIYTLQLMTIFDLQRELAQLSLSSAKITSTNTDVKDEIDSADNNNNDNWLSKLPYNI